MMTPDQAMAGLGAIVGGGGISAIIVSLMSYMTEARKGRRPSDHNVVLSVGDQYGQTKWAEISASHLGTIGYNLLRIAAIAELDAEKRLGIDFHDRLENKMIILMAQAARHTPQARD